MDAKTPRRALHAALGLLLGAGVLTTPTALAARAINRPYLQSVTPTSAVVVFRADAACPAQVRYAAGTEAEQVASAPQARAQQEVRLEGLKPGTEYRYTVEACGSVLEPEHRFRTAPPPGTTETHFAVIGDFGKGTAAQKATAEQVLKQRPEVIFTVGDNIYDDGTDAEFTKNFLAPMGSLFAEVPLYPLLGNHDYFANDAQASINNFVLPANNPRGTERYYSVDWGNVHVAMLDSICLVGETDHAECNAKEQLAWLESDLKASQAHWKLVMLHNPLLSSAKYGDPADHPENVKLFSQLVPILEAHGVDMVLSGDDHVYERSKPMKGTSTVAPQGQRGIVYLVVGHGAETRNFTRSQQAWSAARNNTATGFLDVRVKGDTLEARMVGSNGTVHDQFTLTKALPAGADLQLSADAEPNRGKAPLEVLLSATVQPGGAQVTWTLPGGQKVTGPQTRQRFDSPGEYSVTVEARQGNQVSTQTLKVVVEEEGGTPSESPPPTEEPGTPPSEPGEEVTPPPASEDRPTLPPEPGTPGEPREPGGGCGATAGTSLAAVAWVALVGWRRRRR